MRAGFYPPLRGPYAALALSQRVEVVKASNNDLLAEKPNDGRTSAV
jgi:hypothetical protein